MVWTNFEPGQHLSLFASRSTQFSNLWRTNILQWGHRHLHLLGFLVWFVPDPVDVGRMFPTMGVIALSWWVGHLPPLSATSAFILSIIASMLALFVAVIATICLSCCSCNISNNIAWDSLSSSADAVSCARSAASLAQLFCRCCGVLFAFQPFFVEVGLERRPCLLLSCLVLPCNHLVFHKHFAMPHLCSATFVLPLPLFSQHCVLQSHDC
jgi:hypothetical protein